MEPFYAGKQQLLRLTVSYLTNHLINRLMNKLKPGAIPKINTSGGQFKMMENINKFQKAIKEYGVPDIDCFQTVDLYERRNIPQVTQCIMALGRTVSIF